MLLNKHNFAVTEFVSKEVSRYTLNSMHVSDKGTCATDGTQLVRVSLPKTSESTQFPSIEGVVATNGNVKPFLLDVTVAKQIGKAIPKKQTIPVLEHVLIGEPSEQNSCLAVTDLDNPQVFRPRIPTGQFPNVDAVIPTEKPVYQIELNAQLLAAIMKAAATFSDTSSKEVLLRFYGEGKAVSIHCRNSDTKQNFTALLMPLRAGDPKHYGIEETKPAEQPNV